MAFNFNWSPLTADADFYARARDLLTTALNKSPKPPIIVDDIFVTELNLGSVPPELEILEIGDLAEDRFRGIFKMSYKGDAYLTLRTRVQANPMNTYLSSKPSFTSPQPLAAAAGLTIPLSITLSEIKLSAFIILVFSKQKGLTLVFRNDPLESLKVSSTFDSIQFVRDYLQRTIEGQLRNLMMDELPAIIHKLSLRLWCPDQLPREEEAVKEGANDEAAIDPFSSQPSQAVDSTGRVLDTTEIAGLSSEGSSDLMSLFSQKNLLRLAALSNSHRTLSLFTPGIRNVMFRAWTGPHEQHSPGHLTPVAPPSLMRLQSIQGGSATYTFTDTSSLDQGSLPSRPSMTSLSSAPIALGAGRPRNARKKKTRVVNLRRPKADSETTSETGETVSDASADSYPHSEHPLSEPIPEEPEMDRHYSINASSKVRFNDKRELPARSPLKMEIYEDPSFEHSHTTPADNSNGEAPVATTNNAAEKVVSSSSKSPVGAEKAKQSGSDSSVILEQAWIMKMAGEIARRVYDEKQRTPETWAETPDAPPPAYQATQ